MDGHHLNMPNLSLPDGHRIAYDKVVGDAPCGVVFLCGFQSNRQGDKALALEALCRSRGVPFVRFDYFGHGDSSGDFAAGSISRWRDDALAVLDQLTTGPQILVGSSMGGWLMLLVALLRPARVRGLVGIAAAPDFTRDLIADALTSEQRELLREQGFIDLPNCLPGQPPYRIARTLIEDGDRNLVLRQPLLIQCPVRLLHGMQDADVPWQTAVRLTTRLEAQDAQVHLIKDAGHRLSRPRDLMALQTVVDDLLATAGFTVS
jgi:pimeloyl-ACP methyl ester carboxylesterase